MASHDETIWVGLEVGVCRFTHDAPFGAHGIVIWKGQSKYGKSHRVGFKNSAGETFFTSVKNVKAYELVKPSPTIAKGTTSYSVPSPLHFIPSSQDETDEFEEWAKEKCLEYEETKGNLHA